MMTHFDTSEHSHNPMSIPKLLLADDSATIRKVVELTFAEEGIHVTAVSDGASAMQEFVEAQPDIVLVDASLPGTSGYQICEMIKQDDATANIPVLLLVGSFEPFDQDEAERVGADGFLLKPFKSIRDLVGTVKDMLGKENRDGRPPSDEGQVYHELVSDTARTEEDIRISESQGTADIENLYHQSFSDLEIDSNDTLEDIFTESALDDELIDASYHRETGFRTTGRSDNNASAMQTIIDDGVSEIAENTAGEQLEQVSRNDVGVSTSRTLEKQRDDQIARPKWAREPSDEFITLVAEKVVERLSERAIKDVAKVVVPQIAEKLIREALAEEKKG